MQQSSFSWNQAFMPLASTPDVPWQSRLWEGIDEVFSTSLVLRYLNRNLVVQNKSHTSSALLPLEWLRSHVVLHFLTFWVRISVMASGRFHLYIRMNDTNTLRLCRQLPMMITHILQSCCALVLALGKKRWFASFNTVTPPVILWEW